MGVSTRKARLGGHRDALPGDRPVCPLWTAQSAGLVAQTQPEMFASIGQIPDRRRTQTYFIARARGDAMAVLPEIRSIVKSLDPGQPMYAIGTIDEAFADGLSTRRVAAGMLASFSVLALGLAALGIYGVLSHAVTARTREIGLRFALGADGGSVLRLMLCQALRPVAVGLSAGVALVIGGQRFLAASAWRIIRATRLSPLVALTRR